LDVFNPGEKAMTGPTITELDERIAMIRQNINELVEQAAAYSGAEDENRTADRIAEQEQELAKLIELRDALLRTV
jgi:predicted ATPase